MPFVTVTSIWENRPNAVGQDIPPVAEEVLLEAAYAAVGYCPQSAFGYMLAARVGDDTPAEREPGACDVHEVIELRFMKPDEGIVELRIRLFEESHRGGTHARV